MATLYDRIKSRRTELGLTVEELAHKMGYKDKSSISKIENGKADIPQSKIAAFADALGTTPAYLMGWEEQPTPATPIPPGQESKKAPGAKSGEVSDEEIKFALFGGGPVTDAQYEEVKQFVRFIKERDANAGKG